MMPCSVRVRASNNPRNCLPISYTLILMFNLDGNVTERLWYSISQNGMPKCTKASLLGFAPQLCIDRIL